MVVPSIPLLPRSVIHGIIVVFNGVVRVQLLYGFWQISSSSEDMV